MASLALEQAYRGFSALTLDPYKNSIYYFLPFVGALFKGVRTLEEQNPPSVMTKAIEDLTRAANTRNVRTYVALGEPFSSAGGSFSLTTPALFLPYEHLFRPKQPFFGEGKEITDSRFFSDDEIKFLIARELGQISNNNALLRIAIKVTVIATLFAIYATPFGPLFGTALLASVIGMYVISERFFQANADLLGVKILKGMVQNPDYVALGALKKIREQNLDWRKQSCLAKLLITRSGNNLADFHHPWITTRIERLSTRCANGSFKRL